MSRFRLHLVAPSEFVVCIHASYAGVAAQDSDGDNCNNKEKPGPAEAEPGLVFPRLRRIARDAANTFRAIDRSQRRSAQSHLLVVKITRLVPNAGNHERLKVVVRRQSGYGPFAAEADG